MLDITKCFSILVSSGHGDRCNILKSALRKELYSVDEVTGKHKIVIMKHGKYSMPKDYKRISKKVVLHMTPLFSDIDDYFFSIDLPKERRTS